MEIWFAPPPLHFTSPLKLVQAARQARLRCLLKAGAREEAIVRPGAQRHAATERPYAVASQTPSCPVTPCCPPVSLHLHPSLTLLLLFLIVPVSLRRRRPRLAPGLHTLAARVQQRRNDATQSLPGSS